MKSVPIAEAKAHFSALVAEARAGVPIVLTVRGKPAAMLVPIGGNGQESTLQPISSAGPVYVHSTGQAQQRAPIPPAAPGSANMTLAALLRQLRS